MLFILLNTVYDIAVNTAELSPLHAAHCAAEKVWCAGDCSEPLPPSAASSEWQPLNSDYYSPE